MSFNRVSEAQLAQIAADPDRYQEVIDDPDSTEPDGYLDKAWSGLQELFMSSGTLLFLTGGELIDGSEDLFYWSPALVQRTAEKLRNTPFATLAAHYEAAPDDADDELDYLHQHYDVLVKFFDSAATAGSAAVMSMG